MQIKKVVLCVLSSFLFFSCGSSRFKGDAVLTGKVCDVNGNGIEGYNLSFGIGKNVISNKNGFFYIPNMTSGKYSMIGHKKGWTSISEKIDFNDKRSIFVVQVNPISEKYAEVENYIRLKNYKDAKVMLLSEKKANSSDEMFQFYESLLSYCENPSEKKSNAIQKKFLKK